ncbi:MAG: hypothetical protein GY898_12010 [Proteobacteria bacterium]|nr:hypothetical protein [Pseudomonadota bacterium]
MGLTTDHGRRSASKSAPPVEDGKTLIDGRSIPKSADVNTDVGATLGGDEEEFAGPLALQRALRKVEATVDVELVETLGRIDGLRKKEEALQEQLEQLYLELGNIQDALVETTGEFKGALDQRRTLGARRFDMQATVVQRTLLTDAADLRQRAALWKARLDEADSRVRAFKENPELAKQIEEFRRLDERMDTLDLLPESYRGVLTEHHSTLKTKLAPHLEDPVYEDPTPLRLAVAVGLSGGRPSGDDKAEPGRLLAVLPVDQKTHSRAKQGKTDLTARFAFRVLAALSRFVVNIGARSDPQPVDLDGLLGIELAFDDLDIPVTSTDLARALRESFSEATDSQMARINVSTEMVFVPMKTLELLWERTTEEDKAAKTPSRGKKSRSRK